MKGPEQKWMSQIKRVNLCDEELGDALRQSALFAGQDHLQHVPMQLLHDNKHSLQGLKHALQVNNTRMLQVLHGKKGKGSYNQPSYSTVCFSTVSSGCDGPTCKMATSFLSWLSCLVGNLILSITFIATSLPVFLCFPFNRKRFICSGCSCL